MSTSIEAIIERQLKRWELERNKKSEAEKNGQKHHFQPIVTVSRQRGSQGSFLAGKIAERLGYQLLHREIIDQICNSSGYRRKVVESLDDHVRSKIELWFEGIFKGSYVDASDYFRHLHRVIMSIAEHGGVVVVGRGANFILPPVRGFNLRIVASLPARIENLIKYLELSREEAEREIRESDKARNDFIRARFGKNIDDPQAYDFVLNTTHMDIDTALDIAEKGIMAKWRILGLLGE